MAVSLDVWLARAAASRAGRRMDRDTAATARHHQGVATAVRSGILVRSVEAQFAALLALGIEILGREPTLEPGLEPRPVAIDHREPRRVAVLAFLDHVLAEHALELEAEALGRRLARRIAAVALPLEPAIAELVEDVPGMEEQRFGREPAASHVRTP